MVLALGRARSKPAIHGSRALIRVPGPVSFLRPALSGGEVGAGRLPVGGGSQVREHRFSQLDPAAERYLWRRNVRIRGAEAGGRAKVPRFAGPLPGQDGELDDPPTRKEPSPRPAAASVSVAVVMVSVLTRRAR